MEDEMEKSSQKSLAIQLESIHCFISPLGFHYYATEFLKAARSLKVPEHFSPVPYYLYCRSIELSLKSFLLCKGIPKEKLKDFGHDLVKIWKHATELKISEVVQLSATQEACIAEANTYYKSKDFEYFDILNAMRGYRDRPDLEVLDSLASELVTRLEKGCKEAADIPPDTEQ